MFIIILFWLGSDRPSGLLFLLMPALLLSALTTLLHSSSVSLSYFNLAVPVRECLGKHSCMSSPFFIATLNGTFFLRSPGIDFVLVGGAMKQNTTILIMI